uniref:Uncharacterized protein n=1 Tax=Anopheles quadriannulatus TaxID=34691 RepID=A0A182XT17_ANOQN
FFFFFKKSTKFSFISHTTLCARTLQKFFTRAHTLENELFFYKYFRYIYASMRLLQCLSPILLFSPIIPSYVTKDFA